VSNRVAVSAATLAALLVLGCNVNQIVGRIVADAGLPDSGPTVCPDYTCTPSCAGLNECNARCDALGCSFRCESSCTPTCPVGSSCQLQCGELDGGVVDCQVVCSGQDVCDVLSCKEDNCTVGCGTEPTSCPAGGRTCDGGCP
jgi:hypothetical protein